MADERKWNYWKREGTAVFSLLKGEEKFFEPLGHRTISSIKIFLALKHDTQQFRILLLPRLIDSQIVLLLKSSELELKIHELPFYYDFKMGG